MTALNGWIGKGCVHLAVDGAHYNGTVKVINIADKAVVLPGLNMALASRGPALMLTSIVLGTITHFSSFDAALDGLEGMVSGLYETTRAHLPYADEACRFELLIGGISERDGPGLYQLQSYGSNAFEWHSVKAYISPSDEASIDQLRAIGAIPEGLSEADPETAALAIVGAQRDRAWTVLGKPAQVVGGFVNLITVRRDAISTRILKRWTDPVGSRIGDAEAARAIVSPRVLPGVEKMRPTEARGQAGAYL